MTHAGQGVVFGEQGDPRPRSAPGAAPGDERRVEAARPAADGEPFGAQKAAQRGAGASLLEAELGEFPDPPAQGVDPRPQPPEDRFDAPPRRDRGMAGVNRKPNPVATVTGGRWSFLYPRGLPRGWRRVAHGAA
jgi:hypothetical protein